MKILLLTDLEGVAGNVTFQDTYPEGAGYGLAKKRLTADVNACVEALVKEGIDDILVVDGHGPGGMDFDTLKPPAKLLHGRPHPTREALEQALAGYDTLILLGWHARAGVAQGNLSHTGSSKRVDYVKLNGKDIGEIGEIALQYGARGKPVILVTGDDAACREAEDMIPGVTTVAVKQSLARCAAISLATEEAHRRIRDGVKKAMQRHRANPVKPVVWKGPFVLESRYYQTETADSASKPSGVERIDGQTVRRRAETIQDLYG